MHPANRWLLALCALAYRLLPLTAFADKPSVIGTRRGTYVCSNVKGAMTLILEHGKTVC